MVQQKRLTKKVKSKEFYVDNKKFLEEIILYKEAVKQAKQNQLEKPVIQDYLGECFMNIAKKLSNRPNFSGYMYKDDMISDALENCVRYINSFDPEISNNPFAYFTQMIHHAFVRRIKSEKTQLYTKFKMMENSFLHDEPYNKKYINDKSDENMREFIRKFEEANNKK